MQKFLCIFVFVLPHPQGELKTSNGKEISMDFKLVIMLKLKKGAKIPDINIDIAGWQGRISEIIEEYNDKRIALIYIKLDRLTFKQIPDR